VTTISRVDRIARDPAGLATNTQLEMPADPRRPANFHRHRVPQIAERRIADTTLEQPTKDRRIVGGRSAAGIVLHVGDNDGTGWRCESPVDRRIHREDGDRCPIAHFPDLAAEFGSQGFGLLPIIIGHHPDLGADIGHIAHANSCPNETDSTTSLPSNCCILATNPFIGST